MTKFKPNIFLIATMLLPVYSFGAASNCAPARLAHVKVSVTRLHWTQKNGAYELREDLVCSGQKDLGVLPGIAASCISPVLLNCQIELDGSKHALNISGSIYHNDSPFAQTKHFSAGYHLDRNSIEIKTGEAATSDIHTNNLSMKKIGLELQSKLDSPSGVSSRDGFNINVDFEDSDAP